MTVCVTGVYILQATEIRWHVGACVCLHIQHSHGHGLFIRHRWTHTLLWWYCQVGTDARIAAETLQRPYRELGFRQLRTRLVLFDKSLICSRASTHHKLSGCTYTQICMLYRQDVMKSVHTYIHTYIHTYTHICKPWTKIVIIYAYIHAYIHTYMYIYTHTYTHIWRQRSEKPQCFFFCIGTCKRIHTHVGIWPTWSRVLQPVDYSCKEAYTYLITIESPF